MDPNLMHLELDDDHTRFMSEPITRWTLLDFHRAVQMTISGQFETAVARAAEGIKDTKTKAAADMRKWIGEGQKEFENAKEFVPTRFMSEDSGKGTEGSSKWMPFGGGISMCSGTH